MSVAAAIIGWIVIGPLAISPFVLVALLVVPGLRRRWLRPLLRLITGRKPVEVTARIAERELQQEVLDGSRPAPPIGISYMNIEQQLQRGRGASPPDNITLR